MPGTAPVALNPYDCAPLAHCLPHRHPVLSHSPAPTGKRRQLPPQRVGTRSLARCTDCTAGCQTPWKANSAKRAARLHRESIVSACFRSMRDATYSPTIRRTCAAISKPGWRRRARQRSWARRSIGLSRCPGVAQVLLLAVTDGDVPSGHPEHVHWRAALLFHRPEPHEVDLAAAAQARFFRSGAPAFPVGSAARVVSPRA
jgi:hypothetical protein